MTQQAINDWNRQVIEEFRANGGKVGGQFAGAPLLLLTTTGAKSGQPRIAPLAYANDGGHIYIFASKAGAPTNPDWYHNLLAHPDVTVEIGTERFAAKAVVLPEAERDRIFAIQAKLNPGFAAYQEKTTRKIPVVELVRQAN
ncbi:MAG TPA: nitroreductase family deazaflavin-dependent oxidoreductase [Ktedonobacteraceae bacterium]|nr:nitroreductase family deazaflavin-dependent oxidoreductase [Ktedonobacteraceae bacterium]